jgi:hypothetical protein
MLVSVTISRGVSSLVQDEQSATSSTGARGSVADGSPTNPEPTPQRAPGYNPRPPQPQQSTVVHTLDTVSVVEVQGEDDPTLLATGKQWSNAKAAQTL